MKIEDKGYIFYDSEGVEETTVEGGYFNIETLIDDAYPFLFVVGGRGRGKTYSALKFLRDKRHVFIRRTEDEIKTLVELDNADDMAVSESPWRQINEDLDGDGHCIKAYKIASGRYMFCDIGNRFNWNADKDEQDKIKKPLANIVALSAVGKVKGAGYENVPYILYDEFIPLQGTRNTKFDGLHLMQIYETISRNREKNGKTATKLICLANATTIANSVFLEFGFINTVYEMVKKGFCRVDMPDKGVRILLLPATGEFTEAKKNTALYKAISKTSAMYRSSIENEFVSDDFTDVTEKCNLQGAKHWYYFTSRQGKIYTMYSLAGNKWRLEEGIKGKGKKEVYNFNLNSTKDIYLAEKTVFADTWFDYCEGLISFDSYEAKVLYFDIINKKITPR